MQTYVKCCVTTELRFVCLILVTTQFNKKKSIVENKGMEMQIIPLIAFLTCQKFTDLTTRY